ncbi:MAG TPA: chemotaxis protein CheX [Candidatus Saccharimonadales bacterium]|nr:chemotaxis protein CheX [Candidatus Saccharimonadales bacterium]
MAGYPGTQNASTVVVESIDTREWPQLLREGASEVFEMMVGLPLLSCPPSSTPPPVEFTAVVGIAGAISGVFSIRCDQKTAFGIACGMLGVELSEAGGEMWDALGELCNMVIGNFKAKTGKVGESAVLSVPTVIHGHDYEVRPLVNGSRIECLMRTADGNLSLRLDYRLS